MNYLPGVVLVVVNIITVVVTVSVSIGKFEERFISNQKEHAVMMKMLEQKVDRSEFNMYINMSEHE